MCQRLFPLATVGDGNCLLHAASLGMWGFHDRLLTLRKALHRTLTSHLAKGAIKRRWRLQLRQKNMEAGGLVYTEEEWDREWKEILRIASPQRRQESGTNKDAPPQSLGTISEEQSDSPQVLSSTLEQEEQEATRQLQGGSPEASSVILDKSAPVKDSGKPEPSENALDRNEDAGSGGAYESLEEIHVFVLAHVLRRPIVIVADAFLRDFSGDPIAPIPFGGIYLPLECPPETCFKSPLVLAFDSAHFSALVVANEKAAAGKKERPLAAIPVVGPDYNLIPIHFSILPTENFDWDKLEQSSYELEKLDLNMDQKLELLRRYMDIMEVKIPTAGKKDAKDDKKGGLNESSVERKSCLGEGKDAKEGSIKSGDKIGSAKSWLANQLVKVGNMAGVLVNVVHSTFYVAKLQTDRKPEYYDKMIENYIESAKERFEEEKKIRAQKAKHNSLAVKEPAQPCISPGCHLYGTADTSYLCTACYKTQQRSFSESGKYTGVAASERTSSCKPETSSPRSYLPPPSYSANVPYDYFTSAGSVSQAERGKSCRPQGTSAKRVSQSNATTAPPTYAEACEMKVRRAVPSDGTPSPQANSIADSSGKCARDDCPFFGSAQNRGYCSSCFKKYQQTLAFKADSKSHSF